jgi:autophagy-related protein 9
MTGSRPFLNLLNPLGGGRVYRGYERARDDVVEEEGEGEEAEEGEADEDRGEGPSSRPGWMRATTGHGPGDPPIRMHGVTSPSNNAGIEDEEEEEDDGEVPQSFMIEARRPRNSREGRNGKPKSPTHARHSSRTSFLGGGAKQQISMPPRPSDLQSAADFALPLPNTAPVHSPTPKQGLDEYERALWNWVNVYNLDAYLQEARHPASYIRPLPD